MSGGVRVYLGLGSNQGDREATLARALAFISALPQTRVVRASRLYQTAAVGGPEQADYLNQVVEIETALDPEALLAQTQFIEARLGRVRTVRWGPRTLDIDILWYHGFAAAGDHLQVPHPRMEERRFVLEPLAEIAPELILASGRTVVQALALVSDQVVELYPAER